MTEFLARDAGALVVTGDYWHAREYQARRARCSLRIDDPVAARRSTASWRPYFVLCEYVPSVI